jgi:hypothetical protein
MSENCEFRAKQQEGCWSAVQLVSWDSHPVTG